MKILAIETSCDETAVAILDITGPLEKPEIKVLGNALLSQIHLHAQFGGVYPNLAKREHQKNLPILLEKVLEETRDKIQVPNDIDYIAVTTGPGLEPALWTGITFAEDLGKKWSASGRKVPVIPVNHMEGHVFSVLYNLKEKLKLPALALLVSGGHTELVYVKGFGNYEIIGYTVDDAVGEAFDKVARMLGFSYPGGPKISALAQEARGKRQEINIKFPRPMINSPDLNFSFSGLKTAVLYYLRDHANTPHSHIAKEFEDAAVEVLVEKTRKALMQLPDIKTLIIAGGVSANAELRLRIEKLVLEFPDLNILFPIPLLTTDNAIMVGIAGYVRAKVNPKILSYQPSLEAKGNLSISSLR